MKGRLGVYNATQLGPRSCSGTLSLTNPSRPAYTAVESPGCSDPAYLAWAARGASPHCDSAVRALRPCIASMPIRLPAYPAVAQTVLIPKVRMLRGLSSCPPIEGCSPSSPTPFRP